MGTLNNVKRIAIIGAGPSGLAATKYLLSEKKFDRIDIFEQQNQVGGVWHSTPAMGRVDVPQLDPHQPLEEPTWQSMGQNETLGGWKTDEPIFVTPVYDQLETNIPKMLMQYSDKPFPEDAQLFPRHETVTNYLDEYATEIKHLISFQTQVQDVRLQDNSTDSWIVTTKDLRSGAVRRQPYDAIVAASGHYNVPYIPSITGIARWNEVYPDTIVHSKFYRSPERYRNMKVIVVGNSASGIDIGAQIATACRQPLFMSSRSESFLAPAAASWKEELPQIAEFLPPESYSRGVRFEDGRIEENIDAVVFATGYFYSFPFLSSLQPRIIEDGTWVLHMYQQFLYIEHPTLFVPVLNHRIVPFPAAESQAAVVARIWAGRLSLPSKQDMYAWEKATIAERGTGKDFHTLEFPAVVDYVNELHYWSKQAKPKEGLDNDGHGKEGPLWKDKERWMRERFPEIKKAFGRLGEARHFVRTLEQVGFDFEAWKAEQEAQDHPKSLL